ncbi:hypothetical protein MLC52_10230 [Sulfurimonas sp. NW15]|uniref:hypothetical protein n=1 Tax=Sulfurimonas sp. NW15 TaxID=2922729 RepID=UPI003DA923E8
MNIIKIFIASMVLIFTISGCQGTNSDSSATTAGNTTTNSTNTTTSVVLNKLTINPDNIIVTSSNYTKNIILDAYTNQNTKNVNTTLLVKYPADIINNNINVGSLPSQVNVVDGEANFQYTGPTDIVDTINALQAAGLSSLVSLNLYDETTGVNVNLDLNLTQNSIKYNLVSVPTGSKITQPNQSIAIDVYLEDDTTSIKKPVADEKIIVDYFNGTLGTMNSFSAITDANGHAVFNYTSPATLKADGQDYNLTFRMSNDTTVLHTSLLTVDTTPPPEPDYSNYTLSVVPSAVTITEASQSKTIDLYLEDNNSRPVANETILLDYFDGSKGTANSFSAVTDTNGHVTFNYTAPSSIADGTLLTMTFRGKNTTLNTVNTVVTVDTTPPPEPDYSNYTLSVVPSAVTITEASQSKTIDLYLEDNNSRPVANETILLDYFDGSKGTANSFSAVTDTNGHVTFNYTAPSSIADGTLLTMTFRGKNTTLNTVNTVVTVDTTPPPEPDYSNYTLSVVPSAVTITEASQSKTIDLYLEDNNSRPVANETILLDYFDGSKGTANSFSAVTDTNGHVTFNYTAPSSIADGTLLTMTFRGKNTTLNTVNTVVTVDTTPPPAKIHLENSILDISSNAQTEQIKVLAFDENNQSLQTGSIFVRYPSEIVDQNISGGKFNENEVNIVNGEAIFTFVGPDPLKAMNSLDFTFVYKEDTNVTASLTVNYKPAVPTVILTDNNVTVTTNSQIVNIDVRVISEDNTPYLDGNVKIFYPDDVRSGRDIGGFASSTVAVSNGIANFVYTAPTRLDENTSDIVFKFYHEANPLEAKTFTVKIAPDANQTVLNSYLLKSTLSDANATIGISSSKLMSFFITDDSNTLVPDSNVTSITIEMLNPILGQIEDTKGNSGSSLTIADKNNVTVNLQTNTVSGILPLKVTAVFTDSNNNQQTLTKVFNIVVLSGPPSAISFSYAGTDSQSKQNDAKMIEHWVITVTDRYNNLVNTNPAVSMGAIVGYVQSSPFTASNAGNYIYYEPNEVNGTLSSTNNNFTTTANVFDNVDQTNDYLVTFGDGYTYNASGKWDINTNNSNTLDLKDTYEGNDTSNLGFAVGHNYRQDTCEFGTEWVANVYPQDAGNYVIDSTGSMRINVEYDYYLVGKDVVLWANLIGKQYDNNTTVKIGEARKITLRGTGLVSPSFAYSTGFQGLVHLPIMINDTSEYYKNANFSATIIITGVDVNWTVVGTSMDLGSNGQNVNIKPYTDATMYSCNYGGVAYVDINFTSPSLISGTVSLTNLKIMNEF